MRILVLLLVVLLPIVRPVDAPIMEVRPGAEDTAAVAGQPGGPFAPSEIVHQVRHVGAAAIEWRATNTQEWIALSRQGGILAPGEAVTVTVSIAGVRYVR
jgi:hypothetical protein